MISVMYLRHRHYGPGALCPCGAANSLGPAAQATTEQTQTQTHTHEQSLCTYTEAPIPPFRRPGALKQIICEHVFYANRWYHETRGTLIRVLHVAH